MFRFPNESNVQGVFQKDDTVNTCNDFRASGFVFAPFNATGKKILITGKHEEGEMGELPKNTTEKKIEISDAGREIHIKLVEGAIAEIKTGNLKKVVLSRPIKASTKKSPVQIFHDLLVKYTSAFCYCWYHPKIGMWLGATPEQLLQYQNGEIFTTSLAGTLPIQIGEDPQWTSKEQEEQQMVTDYIEASLHGKVDNLEVSKQKSLKAGKLWHLESKIKGKLNSAEHLGSLIRKLHPTPAICGLPKERSLDFIVRNENYDREFYTGYLGPVNLKQADQTNLFVNLRCLKYLGKGQVMIFVGGGITASSKPLREWEETQFKSRTILEVL